MKKLFYLSAIALLGVSLGHARGLKGADIETIFRGSHSSYAGKDGQHIVEVTSEEQWEKLWEKIHEGYDELPDCPKIDFKKYGVVAAVDQLRPSTGYSLEIEKVELIDEGFTGKKKLRVSKTVLRSVHPGSAVLVGFMITRPIHIVKYKKEVEDSES